jgi:hypothetical protein
VNRGILVVNSFSQTVSETSNLKSDICSKTEFIANKETNMKVKQEIETNEEQMTMRNKQSKFRGQAEDENSLTSLPPQSQSNGSANHENSRILDKSIIIGLCFSIFLFFSLVYRILNFLPFFFNLFPSFDLFSLQSSLYFHGFLV